VNTFMFLCRSVLLGIENCFHRSCRENQTRVFCFEKRALCEITWKNIVERERPRMTVWHMRIACWISKATNTHSEYVILTDFHCSSGCTNAPLCYVVHTSHVLFIMPVIDWLGVSETTFRFLVEPWFIMFARLQVHIFVAHS
jgi:hypothetical protein